MARAQKSVSTDFLICGLLAISTFAVYAPSLSYGFINYDDPFYITGNQIVRGGLTIEGIRWAFTTDYVGNWHPLTWLSHMADVELFGVNPPLHRMTNILLHVANSILLFLVFRKMTGDRWPSAAVAALFALHPFHVESVVWVAERKDVLSTFFAILAIAAYQRWRAARTWHGYALIMGLFALALMAKPMVVTLPCILLLLDLWPGGRFTGVDAPAKALLRATVEKVPLFLLAAISSAITIATQSGGGATRSLVELSLYARAANALSAYGSYAFKTLIPVELVFFYPHAGDALPVWKAALGGGFLLSVSTLALVFLRRAPYVFVGWFWYVGTLLPVIGILQVGDQAMADRYTYVPLIGLFIVFAWGARDLVKKWPNDRFVRAVPALAVCFLGVLCAVTVRQVRFWRDDITLYERCLRLTENNAPNHVNLGMAYHSAGRFDDAEEQYLAALRIEPEAFIAHLNLGSLNVNTGRPLAAVNYFKAAAALQPDRIDVYINLGKAYAALEDWSPAVAAFRQAIARNPEALVARFQLGAALIRLGRHEEGAVELIYVVERRGDDYGVRDALGEAFLGMGRAREAAGEHKAALKLNADCGPCHYHLALAYIELGDKGSALIHLREAESREAHSEEVTKLLTGLKLGKQ